MSCSIFIWERTHTLKEIQLTQGQVALVDDEDFEWLNTYKWHAYWNGDTCSYYVKRNLSIKMDGTLGTVRMHRQILSLSTGDRTQVDHINHDTLDNRRENLRIASNAENGRNRRAHRDGTSGFKGVTFHKLRGKWMAAIKHAGKSLYLGLFLTREEAAIAYNEAALKYYGEFALLNELKG